MQSAVLVCVTAQPTSHRLIEKGAEIARAADAPLLVLAVLGSGPNLLELPHVAATLDALYARAGHVGAEMTILTDRDPCKAISAFAKQNGAGRLVVGQGSTAPGSFLFKLMQSLPKAEFLTFAPELLPEET